MISIANLRFSLCHQLHKNDDGFDDDDQGEQLPELLRYCYTTYGVRNNRLPITFEVTFDLRNFLEVSAATHAITNIQTSSKKVLTARNCENRMS